MRWWNSELLSSRLPSTWWLVMTHLPTPHQTPTTLKTETPPRTLVFPSEVLLWLKAAFPRWSFHPLGCLLMRWWRGRGWWSFAGWGSERGFGDPVIPVAACLAPPAAGQGTESPPASQQTSGLSGQRSRAGAAATARTFSLSLIRLVF